MLKWTIGELAKLGVRPRKKLGQNFTVNPKIISFFLSHVPEGSEVFEVGAGLGTLTEALRKKASKVIALEKDTRLCSYLKNKFEHAGNVEIVCGDALEIEIASDAVVGSLPYSISGPFIAKLATRDSWKKGVFLLQKEVAERLVASPGSKEYGRLSVLVQLCCKVELGPTWGPSSFWPPPQVKSQHVILVKERNLPKDLSDFLACVFSQRNKLAKKVLARCGSEWRGNAERVRDLMPQQLLEAYLKSLGK